MTYRVYSYSYNLDLKAGFKTASEASNWIVDKMEEYITYHASPNAHPKGTSKRDLRRIHDSVTRRARELFGPEALAILSEGRRSKKEAARDAAGKKS